jgi:hypothetical protein
MQMRVLTRHAYHLTPARLPPYSYSILSPHAACANALTAT